MKNTKLIILLISIVQVLIMFTLYHPIKYLLIFMSVMMIYLLYSYSREHEKQARKDIIALSQALEQIVNNRAVIKHDLNKDDLVSKIKNQLYRIVDLLDYHHDKEKAERERLEQLIGDISHQLKTPLSNLKMYQELLKTCDDDHKDRFHQALEKQIEKLSWLVEALMTLSRVESGCIVIEKKSSNLDRTILEAIGMVHLKAEKKDISIQYKPCDYLIEHDNKWTTEAIYNVLDNSIKYSEGSSIIKVELVESEMFTDVQIRDQGVGIDEDDLNNIFKRFYRGVNTEYIEGIGIGLYLSQEIMKRQGGYIYAKSLKKGSQFNIKLRR